MRYLMAMSLFSLPIAAALGPAPTGPAGVRSLRPQATWDGRFNSMPARQGWRNHAMRRPYGDGQTA